jgi:hypothetical protein
MNNFRQKLQETVRRPEEHFTGVIFTKLSPRKLHYSSVISVLFRLASLLNKLRKSRPSPSQATCTISWNVTITLVRTVMLYMQGHVPLWTMAVGDTQCQTGNFMHVKFRTVSQNTVHLVADVGAVISLRFP